MPDGHNADETAEAESKPSVNRRSFVKALGGTGGAAVTGGMFASSVKAKSSSPSTVTATERITGDELAGVIKSMVDKRDVRNVISQRRRDQIKHQMAVFSDRTQVDSGEGSSKSAASEVRAAAATHTLENGNEMTSAALVTSDDRLVAHYEYDTRVGHVRSEARLWEVKLGDEIKDTRLSLVESSANGESTTPLTDIAGSCSCWNNGYHKERVCQDLNLGCAT
jgi:hypothetical protein